MYIMNCLDWSVALLLLVYNVTIIVLYIFYNDISFTQVGTFATVFTHLAAIPPLFLSKSLLFWVIFLTTIASTLYHMAQVGWFGDDLLETGWYIPSDHPLRRIDHGFSIALVFLVSVTIWYDTIPTLWIILVTFVLMSISVAYINTVFLIPIREWIALIIVFIDIIVVSCQKLKNKNKSVLWLGLFVFIISAIFYAVATRYVIQGWEWYIHSAWHVNVYSSIYIVLRAQKKIPVFIRTARFESSAPNSNVKRVYI